MAFDETVRKLMQISTPKQFKEQEYICYEGQPGDEMYVVLKGCVGIYLISAINTFEEIARITAGDFFGEMSIFDKLPRSASCIALEDTTCIAVNSGNLEKFVSACPDMAEKMIINMNERIRKLGDKLSKSGETAPDGCGPVPESLISESLKNADGGTVKKTIINMSDKIRTLNNKVYKSRDVMLSSSVPEFSFPPQYSYSHDLKEPPAVKNVYEKVKTLCPLCGEEITAVNIKYNLLNLRRTDSDRRQHYADCEPLWYYVRSCPHCHYSNYYLDFFKVYKFNKGHIADIVEKQNKVIEKLGYFSSAFDRLFIAYLQAIDLNMNIKAGDNVLIGKLWLDLYWLMCDAYDRDMKGYCRKKALQFLSKAYDGNEKPIADDYSRQSVALTLTNLFLQEGNKKEAVRMCSDALAYPDQTMRSEAYKLKNQIGQ